MRPGTARRVRLPPRPGTRLSRRTLGTDQLRRNARVDRPLAVRRAPARDRAHAAGRLLGVTDAAAVPDQVVAEHHPVALLEQGPDGVLDLHRVGLVGPAEAAGQ